MITGSVLGGGDSFAAAGGEAPLEDGPVQIISSGNLDYDFSSGVVSSGEPVEARFGPYRIEAGSIRWERERGLIFLAEGVRLDNAEAEELGGTSSGDADFFEVWWPDSYQNVPFILTGDSARIDVAGESVITRENALARFPYGRLLARSVEIEGGETPSLSAAGARAGSGPFLVAADSVEAGEEEVILQDAGLFLSDPNDWGPRIYADKIRHGAGDHYISLYGVTLGVGPIPVLYLPRAWLRDWDLGVSFDLGGGFSDSLGLYGELGLSFKASNSLRLSPSVAYFGRRGWLFSPNFSWNRTSDSGEYYTEGSVLVGGISDRGGSSLRGVDRFGNPIGRSRGYVLAQGLGNQRTGWSFVNQFEARSDTEVLRDFRPGLESRYFAPESFSELLIPMGPFSFSALGRFRTMDMTESLEAIPSVSVLLEPDYLGATPLMHEGWVDFSRLERTNFDDVNQASATRWEGAYRVAYEVAGSEWLSVRPVGGVRQRIYQDVRASGSDGNSTLFEAGFDVALDFHREWPVKSEIWDIDGLTHQTRPIVGYRWMPSAGMPDQEIPQILPGVYTSGVDPLGFSNLTYQSDLGAEQVLRIGWENRLLAGSFENAKDLRDLGTFSVYQDFVDQRSTDDSLPSNTMLALSANPSQWLSLELFSRVETKSMTLRELVPGLSLRDGDRWESTWYFQSLQREVNELLWEAEFALNRNNRILFEMRYSGQRQQITKQVYGWRHQLGNAWLFETKMIFRRGDSREGPFQINFGITSLLF